MAKEWLICGGTRYDGRKETTFDYCRRCLESDIRTLEFIHERSGRQKEASQQPIKDSQEA